MGKTFFIRERYKISLVGMISDLFNHPHFNNPLTNISAADPGKFTSTVTFFAAEKSAFRIASVKLRVSF